MKRLMKFVGWYLLYLAVSCLGVWWTSQAIIDWMEKH